ncbi:hypothetical protein L210DRAFT_3525191 [Boletus edulis BED1]|uniref:Uncharacterized protein n=1 Tax=Boletus edulis BED1 TaxID=1328754 RepID=A0AAD4GIW4_BOLED|nr:hypothetical protein L210DRAFT_3525191 [Boletus edulis BED1]
MSHSPSPAIETRGALKRRIATLQQENATLLSKMTKTPTHSYVREGRAIRRLVCLSDPVTNLIAEYDRRIMLVESEDEVNIPESNDDEERAFRSYKKLVRWCPSVKGLVQPSTQGAVLAAACQELQKGADGARGDDANNLKSSVATWLNEQDPSPVPLFIPTQKRGRGFDHDITGQLLCPVDYDWLDPLVRDAIRDYHPRYTITAYMWPMFLYRQSLYNAKRPSKGLFKGELLVRAFRCIFTSPSSARDDVEHDADDADGTDNNANADNDSHPVKVRKSSQRDVHTRTNVATILKMRSVEPRAIAYVTVQLRFALSSRKCWGLQDDNFNYDAFYHNIVNWFEKPRSQAKAQEVDELLLWWTRAIFGRQHASTLNPAATENLSVELSMN